MKRFTEKIATHVQRLITQPKSEMTRAQLRARNAIDLARHCARALKHDRATQMAAALTYHTLFSLLPTIVLAMVVLQAFVNEPEQQRFKATVVDFLMPESALQLDELDPDSNRRELGEARLELSNRIQGLMDSLSQANFRSIGVVGIIVFIYGATALLTTVERSFNSIFNTTQGRPWYIRLPLYYTVITLGPLVLIVGQIIQTRLFSALDAGAWTNWLVGPLGVFMILVATWLVLFATYSLMPNTTVNVHGAAIGSVVAAVLWVGSKELFRLYVSHAAIATLYGALALLPLFLLWLFVTWLIILFGLEIAYTLQAMKGRHFKYEVHEQRAELPGDPQWLIPIMVQIARDFQTGRPSTAQALADELGLPVKSITALSEELLGAGLLHRVDAQTIKTGDAGYVLASPPEQIPVHKLLDAGRAITRKALRGERDPHHPGWAIVDELQQRVSQEVEGETLATLVAENESAGAAGADGAPSPASGTDTPRGVAVGDHA